MIDEYGDNLHVLLISEVDDNWLSFSAWYSLRRNLPYAKVSLCYLKNPKNVPTSYFQWAKRIGIRCFGMRPKESEVSNFIHALAYLMKEFDDRNYLVMNSASLALQPLSLPLRENLSGFKYDAKGACFSDFDVSSLSLLYDNYMLYNKQPEPLEILHEARDSESFESLISISKGCGKWIDKMKGCPFSSVSGLLGESMTVNEQKIFDLWRDLVPLYHALN